jgi:hypothetical protein
MTFTNGADHSWWESPVRRRAGPALLTMTPPRDALPRDLCAWRGRDAIPRVRRCTSASRSSPLCLFPAFLCVVHVLMNARRRTRGSASMPRSPLKRTNNRENNPERLCYGMDIVDTKYRCAAQCASHDARDRSGISIRRVGNSEDVTDHGLAGNRK